MNFFNFEFFLFLNDISSILFSLYHLIKINKKKCFVNSFNNSTNNNSNIYRKNMLNGYVNKNPFKIWILITLFLYSFYVMFCSFEK